MGVQSLWDLLAPVGRRVNVETLSGKKLAIDASIWMIQFMKAMRDDKGEMMRNAHLLGFFRRICKLLFLRTKPVFVFDGGTPALKRRTVIARRRQRENAQAKIRKTAEKLLLNHLKALRLKELAKDLENQRGNNVSKGKKVLTEEMNMEGNDMVSANYNQESVDELLAASLMAEEDGSFPADASTSIGMPAEEVEEADGYDDEEMILPTIQGKVDPAVLASLPPSMQLDLLVQMRERLMAENRQKYQKVKKAPAKFSELQIQAYLKTVAFRREIDEVQKSAAGRGLGGVQTSRIASEANREFIFSSSFSGDKEALASVGVAGTSDGHFQSSKICSPVETVEGSVASKNDSNIASESVDCEPSSTFENDVETYFDERGRLRVSRVRAMGIRMTRDLQRNLDLMREIEQEKMETDKNENSESTSDAHCLDRLNKLPSKIHLQPIADHSNNEKISSCDRHEEFLSGIGSSLVISFDGDGVLDSEGYDDLFYQLVSEDPVMKYSDNVSPKQLPSVSSLADEWDEETFGEKGGTLSHDSKEKNKLHLPVIGISDESEVEWEEGGVPAPGLHEQADPSLSVHGEHVFKGDLEEEANLQEAIRRSIVDLRNVTSMDESIEKGESKKVAATLNVDSSFWPSNQVKATVGLKAPLVNAFQSSILCSKAAARVPGMDVANEMNTDTLSGTQLKQSASGNSNNEGSREHPCETYLNCHSEASKANASKAEGLDKEKECVASGASIENNDIGMNVGQLTYASKTYKQWPTSGNIPGMTNINYSILANVPGASLEDNNLEAETSTRLSKKKRPEDSFLEESMTDVNAIIKERDSDCNLEGTDDNVCQSTLMESEMDLNEFTEATLRKEMQNLDEECANLGNEQKRLERNADSVSSEMFAECQELLQMFGLPYIIAPMEAEAQCAYMESTNLVDGVVTDDSDVFLFGARNVYKNIFDDRKYVETYFMKDIENELGLNREKLINMALLLGSDYTEGVSGIGIVNAIEVVNAFPEKEGLQKFREWIESPDPSILGVVDLHTGTPLRKKRSRDGDCHVGCSDLDDNGSAIGQNASESLDQVQIVKQNFMDKHRNVSKNWHLPSSFPSEAVISAYNSPQVDKSTEPFTWGKPDHFFLRRLCWEKFGWSSQKADELLVPVIKEYGKHETQLRLEAFYTFNERFAKIRSKRVKDAVKGITGKTSLDAMDNSVPGNSKGKKRESFEVADDDTSGIPSNLGEDNIARNGTGSPKKQAAKQSNRRTRGQQPVSQGGSADLQIQAEGELNSDRGSTRRRGRGRKRAQSVGKRKVEKSELEPSDTCSDGDNGSEKEQTVSFRELHHVRRSMRPRKFVKYNTDDDPLIDEVAEERVYESTADVKIVEEEPIMDAVIFGKNEKQKVGDDPVEGLSAIPSEVGDQPYNDENVPESGGEEIQRQNHITHPQEDKDYLVLGGGFCLDEDEGEGKTHERDPRADIFGGDGTDGNRRDSTQHSRLIEESETNPVSSSETAMEGHLHKASSPRVQNSENLDVAAGVAAIPEDNNDLQDEIKTSHVKLKAMPFLRRRRKR